MSNGFEYSVHITILISPSIITWSINAFTFSLRQSAQTGIKSFSPSCVILSIQSLQSTIFLGEKLRLTGKLSRCLQPTQLPFWHDDEHDDSCLLIFYDLFLFIIISIFICLSCEYHLPLLVRAAYLFAVVGASNNSPLTLTSLKIWDFKFVMGRIKKGQKRSGWLKPRTLKGCNTVKERHPVSDMGQELSSCFW